MTATGWRRRDVPADPVSNRAGVALGEGGGGTTQGHLHRASRATRPSDEIAARPAKAVFAMISALFCVMLVAVGSTAAGREVRDELDRIRRGQRPAEGEVRRQWDEVTARARSRSETLRVRLHHPERKGQRG